MFVKVQEIITMGSLNLTICVLHTQNSNETLKPAGRTNKAEHNVAAKLSKKQKSSQQFVLDPTTSVSTLFSCLEIFKCFWC